METRETKDMIWSIKIRQDRQLEIMRLARKEQKEILRELKKSNQILQDIRVELTKIRHNTRE